MLWRGFALRLPLFRSLSRPHRSRRLAETSKSSISPDLSSTCGKLCPQLLCFVDKTIVTKLQLLGGRRRIVVSDLEKVWAQPSAAPFAFAAKRRTSAMSARTRQIEPSTPAPRNGPEKTAQFTAFRGHKSINPQDISVFIFHALSSAGPIPRSLLSAADSLQF
jgi:hypothetical protein